MARRAGLDLAAKWRGRLERFDRSAMSIVRFCEAEGVSDGSFYQWRRKLRAADAARQSADERPRQSRQDTPPLAAFAPVRLIGGTSVTAHLPGGTRLEIPLADEDAARAALETLIDADARRALHPSRGDAAC